jgi:putative ABC transport system permease protein
MRTTGLARRGLLAIALGVVAVGSLLVPRWRRAEWRREWEAELWYQQRDIVRRSSGAISHALWLLHAHWSLDMVIQDVRYGARMLRRNPTFTLIVSLTLALGIGASTAIFSIVNAVLWRPLPYKDPGRLAQLWETNPDRDWTEAECAPANVADWRRDNQSFEGLAAYAGGGRDAALTNVALIGGGEPERLKGLQVTGNFFAVLGIEAAMGRTFEPEEEWQGRDAVVVLSDGLWRRRFGADPAVVGHSIALNGRSRTIIGVLPAGFRFGNAPIDLWVPMGWTPAAMSARRVAHLLRVVGRLKPGVSIEQARADLRRIALDLERRYPTTNTHMSVGVGSFKDWVVGPSRTALLVFLAAVGFVLLVACANVANLLLARGLSRDRELAIRAALGAGRMRVIRQMLTESLLLAAIGGALGLGAAYAAVRLVIAYGPPGLPRIGEIRVDHATLWFTIAVTTLTGIAFGMLPARHSTVTDVAPALRRTIKGGSPAQSRIRSLLVVAELSLSVVLLVGATLLIRSFVSLNHVDLGFDPRGAVTFEYSLPRSVYATAAKQDEFLGAALSRARALPGIAAAGASERGLLKGLWTSDFSVEHRAIDDFGIEVRHNEVSPGYFDAIGARILRGRDFRDGDGPDAPLVVVVNDALVRRYFKGEDPIGQRLNFDRPGGTSPWRTIIGVVRDFREERVDTQPRPTIYESLLQSNGTNVNVVVRTGQDAAALAATLRATVRDVDPNVPIAGLQALSRVIDDAITPQRFTVTLMGVFAAIALVLTCVGLYGVLSYLAGRRTHEIGLRMALGAQAADVARLVAGQAFVLVAAGMTAGLVLALVSGRLMSGLLFGVDATDPITYAAVTVLLLLVTCVAVCVPVCRAVRISPVAALQEP